MKISSVRAKNFRALEDFQTTFTPGYCVFSGKNNSGKSSVIAIIENFLGDQETRYYTGGATNRINFKKDATQWKSVPEIELSLSVQLDSIHDSELFTFVHTISSKQKKDTAIDVCFTEKFRKSGTVSFECRIGDHAKENEWVAGQIRKKFRSATSMIIHNSAIPARRMLYSGHSYIELMRSHFSNEDETKISKAENTLKNHLKRATKPKKAALQKLLERLSGNHQVEFTHQFERTSYFPLQVRLNDGSADVPLHHWGAGTQNRTRILLSVLEAIALRIDAKEQEKASPVFIVEEPESFLHPSTQAEFGRLLCDLAKEFDIQIIATTHSPYLLNQREPEANILLERSTHRKSSRGTTRTKTDGKQWMAPFAQCLGIIPKEFEGWKEVMKAGARRLILVEGEIDKEYFSTFKSKYPNIYVIPDDVDVVSYGGKDSLKVESIMKFVVGNFERVFITFDLDAKKDVSDTLCRIGLKENKDFIAIGDPSPGFDCIEGLLPDRITKAVYGEEIKVLNALKSGDSKAKKQAKGELKHLLLKRFKESTAQEKELQPYKNLFTKIASAFK